MLSGGGDQTFAERLRRVGVEFDHERRRSTESAVQSAQHEARVLREEARYWQQQLDGEMKQNATRLGLCVELKQQVEELQDAHRQEAAGRERLKYECAILEERNGLLEAKLAAACLLNEERESDQKSAREGTGSARRATTCKPRACASTSIALQKPQLVGDEAEGGVEGIKVDAAANAEVDDEVCKEQSREKEHCVEQLLEGTHAVDVEDCLRILGSGKLDAALERRLQQLPIELIHALLVAAAGRGDGALVRRIVRLWIGRLVNRRGSAALRAVVGDGSADTLGALLGLAGPSVVVAAAATPDSTNVVPVNGAVGQDTSSACNVESCGLLSLCVEREDAAMMALLLETIRGGRAELLGSVRDARALAEARENRELAGVLTRHLIVELSLVGNARYRRGEVGSAIECYEEAITLCGCPDAAVSTHPGSLNAHAGDARDNLVRLRYNFARALHRTERWSEAREQASAALALDPGYTNAYALRAQAAMAAYDWESAQVDWDRLIVVPGDVETSAADYLSLPADAPVDMWRRRREECAEQLSLGHYEVLGLPRMSSLEAIKRAHRDLAREWHPDKHQHSSKDHQERAMRCFKRIRQAYEVLSNDKTKRAYDGMLLLYEARPLSKGHTSAAMPRREGGADGRAPKVDLRMRPNSVGAERGSAAREQTCRTRPRGADETTNVDWIGSDNLAVGYTVTRTSGGRSTGLGRAKLGAAASATADELRPRSSSTEFRDASTNSSSTFRRSWCTIPDGGESSVVPPMVGRKVEVNLFAAEFLESESVVADAMKHTTPNRAQQV